MHKRVPSGSTPLRAPELPRPEPQSEKGLKFEPFYVPPIGSDRASLERALRLDRRR